MQLKIYFYRIVLNFFFLKFEPRKNLIQKNIYIFL